MNGVPALGATKDQQLRRPHVQSCLLSLAAMRPGLAFRLIAFLLSRFLGSALT